MSHTFSQYDGVLTVRLDGTVNGQALNLDLKRHLDEKAGGPVLVFVDMSFVKTLGQATKAALYRALQHHYVLKIGFFGATPDVAKELSDMLPVLKRLRPLAIEPTEADVRQKLGLIKAATPHKLGGILCYLKKT